LLVLLLALLASACASFSLDFLPRLNGEFPILLDGGVELSAPTLDKKFDSSVSTRSPLELFLTLPSLLIAFSEITGRMRRLRIGFMRHGVDGQNQSNIMAPRAGERKEESPPDIPLELSWREVGAALVSYLDMVVAA
jgi:hypothetical protein